MYMCKVELECIHVHVQSEIAAVVTRLSMRCGWAHVKRFRGGLVFKAHRLLYHSTLGLRLIKKKKKCGWAKALYRGASLIRKRSPLGPYRRPMPRALWWS